MMPKFFFYVGNSLGLETVKYRNAVYVVKTIGFDTIMPEMRFETMMPKNAVYIGNSINFETMMPEML